MITVYDSTEDESTEDESGEETSNNKRSYDTKHHINAIIYWALLNSKGSLFELAMKKSRSPTPNQDGDRNGLTWLHVVALGGHVTLLEKVSDWRDNIMAKAIKKITPLHLAAKQGNYDMVWKFLDFLESENLESKEPSTTGQQRVLQAIVQRTEEDETLISLAASRKDSREHVRLERSLWDKVFQIVEGDKNFFESPHSDEAELIMGLAAWKHTSGEKEHFDKFMGLVHMKVQRTHLHQSPLQLTVCHKFPVALWWLLSGGGYSGENHIREGESMMRIWDLPKPGKEELVHRLIEELLKNPPPVRPALKDDGRPPRFQFERPDSDWQKGTVLNLFVTVKNEIIFELKRASMVDIIYDTGPEEIMRTDGYSNFQAFSKRILSVKEDPNNQQSKFEETFAHIPQTEVEENLRDVLAKPEGENNQQSEEGEDF